MDADSLPVRRIDAIEVRMLTREEIERENLVLKTEQGERYEAQPELQHADTHEPFHQGLYDTALGQYDQNARYAKPCSTCGEKERCPLHQHGVPLLAPLYHPKWIRRTFSILCCVCWHCLRLRIPLGSPAGRIGAAIQDPEARLDYFSEKGKTTWVCNDTTVSATGAPLPVGHPDVGCGRSQPLIRCSPADLKMTVVHTNRVEVTLPSGKTRRDVVWESEYRPLMAEQVLAKFERISAATYAAIGIDVEVVHPRSLFITHILVPSAAIRPPVFKGPGKPVMDDMTNALLEVLKLNRELKRPDSVHDELRTLKLETLQAPVASLITNKELRLGQVDRPLPGIEQGLVGKPGLIRGNLLGKRVRFGGRTVLTSDPTLRVDQIGVPREIAHILTVPERVTARNRAELQAYIRPSPLHPRRANRVTIQRTSTTYDLTVPPHDRPQRRDEIANNLAVGDIVHRHLRDGDVVLVNRQPSLHKLSLMAHEVVVWDGKTFKLSPAVLAPYNADCDGDEINIHVPQTLEAQAEARQLMLSSLFAVGPQHGRPEYGPIQDHLTGLTMLTRPGVFLNRMTAMDMLYSLDGCLLSTDPTLGDAEGISLLDLPVPAILKAPDGKGPLWTGLQIVSMLLPRRLSAYKRATIGKEDEDRIDAALPSHQRQMRDRSLPADTRAQLSHTTVEVVNGTFVRGILDKRSIGAAAGSLLHVFYIDLSSRFVSAFIEGLTRLAGHWILEYQPLSVDLTDFRVDATTQAELAADRDALLKETDDLLAAHQREQTKPPSSTARRPRHPVDASSRNDILKRHGGRSAHQVLEASIRGRLETFHDRAAKLVITAATADNRMRLMYASGAKGQRVNLVQIMAGLGQQTVDGTRVPTFLLDRSLPHFRKFDMSAGARGFVGASFLDGPGPVETFFHAMGARVGLVDTGVKTKEVGYFERRLVRMMEDAVLQYDGTVRAEGQRMIQFRYGDDAFDPTMIESNPIALFEFKTEQALRAYYRLEAGATNDPALQREMLLGEYQLLGMYRAFQISRRRMQTRTAVALPFSFERVRRDAQRAFPTASDCGPLTAQLAVDKLHGLLTRLGLADERYDRPAPRALNRIGQRDPREPVNLLHCFLCSVFAPAVVLVHSPLTREAHQLLLETVEDLLERRRMAPGESVGILAAQSVGRPATQVTLNTFHFAGIAGKQGSQGIPRLKELVNASEPKTRVLTAALPYQPTASEREQMNTAAATAFQLESCYVGDLIRTWSVLYQPSAMRAANPRDQRMFDAYWELPDDEKEVTTFRSVWPWMLRIELDGLRLASLDTTSDAVRRVLRRAYPYLLVITSPERTDENVYVLTIHLRQDGAPSATTIHHAPDNDTEMDLGRPVAPTHQQPAYCDSHDDLGTELATLRRFYDQWIIRRRTPRLCMTRVAGIGPTHVYRGRHMLDLPSDPERPLVTMTGTSLATALKAPPELLNVYTVVSNSVKENARILGIEAARAAFILAMKEMFDSDSISTRHLSLIADVMTFPGEFLPFTWNGMRKMRVGPVREASFERPLQSFADGAVRAAVDTLQGPSEAVMVGNRASLGTGLCALLVDTAMLQECAPDDDGLHRLNINQMYEATSTTASDAPPRDYEPAETTEMDTTATGAESPLHPNDAVFSPVRDEEEEHDDEDGDPRRDDPAVASAHPTTTALADDDVSGWSAVFSVPPTTTTRSVAAHVEEAVYSPSDPLIFPQERYLPPAGSGGASGASGGSADTVASRRFKRPASSYRRPASSSPSPPSAAAAGAASASVTDPRRYMEVASAIAAAVAQTASDVSAAAAAADVPRSPPSAPAYSPLDTDTDVSRRHALSPLDQPAYSPLSDSASPAEAEYDPDHPSMRE